MNKSFDEIVEETIDDIFRLLLDIHPDHGRVSEIESQWNKDLWTLQQETKNQGTESKHPHTKRP